MSDKESKTDTGFLWVVLLISCILVFVEYLNPNVEFPLWIMLTAQMIILISIAIIVIAGIAFAVLAYFARKDYLF